MYNSKDLESLYKLSDEVLTYFNDNKIYLSNLELQKVLFLLFYIYLEEYNEYLFDVKHIKDTRYGVVIYPIYDKYKVCRSDKITKYSSEQPNKKMEIELNKVLKEYNKGNLIFNNYIIFEYEEYKYKRREGYYD